MARTPINRFASLGYCLYAACLVTLGLGTTHAGDRHPLHRGDATYSYNCALPSTVHTSNLPPIEIQIAPEQIVVCSDDNSCGSACRGKHGFNWLFGHGHKCHDCKHAKQSSQATAVSMPTVATLATPVLLASQPQQVQQTPVQQVQIVQQQFETNLAAVRAAQQVEVALANLQGQMAAQKAIEQSTQQTIDRLRKQLDSLGGQTDQQKQTTQQIPNELVTVVTQVKEKLDSVIHLVQVHDEVLKRLHEDGGVGNKPSELDAETRRMVEYHQKALEIILKEMGYKGILDDETTTKPDTQE